MDWLCQSHGAFRAITLQIRIYDQAAFQQSSAFACYYRVYGEIPGVCQHVVQVRIADHYNPQAKAHATCYEHQGPSTSPHAPRGTIPAPRTAAPAHRSEDLGSWSLSTPDLERNYQRFCPRSYQTRAGLRAQGGRFRGDGGRPLVRGSGTKSSSNPQPRSLRPSSEGRRVHDPWFLISDTSRPRHAPGTTDHDT